MARSRLRAKGRRESSSFIPIPHDILESEEYAQLSKNAAVLVFLDLYGQFRGSNNGDFTAAWTVMRKRGWKSKDTLYGAINEALAAGWIIKTRQGGKNKCSLYAVTWKPIDECGGKLDMCATKVASADWKRISKNKNGGPPAGHISTSVVPIRRNANAN